MNKLIPLAILTITTSISAQTAPARVVLVELFTSEGCSDCPPADQLLAQMTGKKTPDGQIIIGISEHVTYWNHLGWKDPFSADQYTERQATFVNRFGLDSAYTPQIVVNGREQFVGGNHAALAAAFVAEKDRPQITLQIKSAQLTGKAVTFTYSASGLPPKTDLRLTAVLVDDTGTSKVERGENAHRELTHAWVARSLTGLGKLAPVADQFVTLPLPPSFASDPSRPRHLVLFAQQGSSGFIFGADAASLAP
jgi:hypothetical protein